MKDIVHNVSSPSGLVQVAFTVTIYTAKEYTWLEGHGRLHGCDRDIAPLQKGTQGLVEVCAPQLLGKMSTFD